MIFISQVISVFLQNFALLIACSTHLQSVKKIFNKTHIFGLYDAYFRGLFYAP